MSKSGRQTIGNELMDQLDDSPFGLLTTPPPAKELNGETSDKPRPKTAKKSQEEDKIDNLKERMTGQMSREVIERVKDAVYWTPGLTVAQLTEEALENALDRLEKKNGKTFEKRKSELKPGRPIK